MTALIIILPVVRHVSPLDSAWLAQREREARALRENDDIGPPPRTRPIPIEVRALKTGGVR